MKDRICLWITTLATLFVIGSIILFSAAAAVEFVTSYYKP
jgi:hypothetical protein